MIADMPNLTYIAEVDSATWRLRLTSKLEFALQVGVRLDSLSDSELEEYSEVVLADFQIDAAVQYGFVAIKNRDEN